MKLTWLIYNARNKGVIYSDIFLSRNNVVEIAQRRKLYVIETYAVYTGDFKTTKPKKSVSNTDIIC